MIERKEGYFRGYQDFELFFQSWSSGPSRATLVVTHGLGEHSDCYNRLAEGILPCDYDIYSWDLRGHGRSEGKRGAITDFSLYCNDLKTYIEFVKKQNKGNPIVLLGHSLGGLITSSALIRHGDMGAKALVLSSPFFGVAVKVPPLKEKLARWAAGVLPELTLHNELKNEDLTHDRKVLEEYEKDILRHDRASTKLFVDSLENVDFCLRGADRIKLPVLFQLAGDDRVVSLSGAQLFAEKVGSKEKEIKIYPEYFHEVYNETGRDLAFSDLKGWLKKW